MRFSEQKAVFDSWLSTYQGVLFKVVRAYAFTPHDQEDLVSGDCHAGVDLGSQLCRKFRTVDLDLSRRVEHGDLMVPQRAQAPRQDQAPLRWR